MNAMEDTVVELYLIRHGQTPLNAHHTTVGGRSNELPLTTLGEIQAEFLGKCLLERGIIPDEVIASPAVRAQDTGTIALRSMGLEREIVIDEDIQEMSQGDWVGRLRDEVYTPETLAEIARLGKDFKAPNGESSNETGRRMFDAVTAIARRCINNSEGNQQQRVFLFTHGLGIKCLASYLLGWDQNTIYRTLVDNVSVSLFTFTRDILQVEYLALSPDQLPVDV